MASSKRPLSQQEPPLKRPRIDAPVYTDSFAPELRRTISKVFSLPEGPVALDGYVSCEVIMFWPWTSTGRLRMLLTTSMGHKFQINMSRACEPGVGNPPTITIGDQLLLGLKGARLARPSKKENASLVYEDGVFMKLLQKSSDCSHEGNCGHASTIIDTWNLSQPGDSRLQSADDDWFSTPLDQPILAAEGHNPVSKKPDLHKRRVDSFWDEPPTASSSRQPAPIVPRKGSSSLSLPGASHFARTISVAGGPSGKDQGITETDKSPAPRLSNAKFPEVSANVVRTESADPNNASTSASTRSFTKPPTQQRPEPTPPRTLTGPSASGSASIYADPTETQRRQAASAPPVSRSILTVPARPSACPPRLLDISASRPDDALVVESNSRVAEHDSFSAAVRTDSPSGPSSSHAAPTPAHLVADPTTHLGFATATAAFASAGDVPSAPKRKLAGEDPNKAQYERDKKRRKERQALNGHVGPVESAPAPVGPKSKRQKAKERKEQQKTKAERKAGKAAVEHELLVDAVPPAESSAPPVERILAALDPVPEHVSASAEGAVPVADTRRPPSAPVGPARDSDAGCAQISDSDRKNSPSSVSKQANVVLGQTAVFDPVGLDPGVPTGRQEVQLHAEPSALNTADTTVVHRIVRAPASVPARPQDEAAPEHVEAGAQIHAVRTQSVPFPQLNTLAGLSKMTSVDVIGVVASFNPAAPKAKTGGRIAEDMTPDGWNMTLYLVDSSVFTTHDITALASRRAGVRITCFAQHHKDWLPQVRDGDVVVLRGATVDVFNNKVCLTGYSDKLRWTAYDMEGNVRKPVLSPGVPRRDSESPYSPFLPEAGTSTLAPTIRTLCEWWTAMRKDIQATLGTVHQVGASAAAGSAYRKHRLLQDIKIDVFCDCTVEVIYVYRSQAGFASVYVTDYTVLPANVPKISSTSCPAELAERGMVLQVALWDSAVKKADEMHPGEFWRFKNIRPKVSKGGSVEGKSNEEHKLSRLNEEAPQDADMEALLERKRKFEKDTTSNSNFPHLRVEQLSEESIKHFHCTVEVLHVDRGSGGALPVVYATDFTSNQLMPLPPANARAGWAKGLQGRVLPVVMKEEQKQFLAMLHPGTCHRFSNLRMVANEATGHLWKGIWGGPERHFRKIATSNEDEEFLTFQENKRKWEGLQKKTSQGSASSQYPTPPPQERPVRTSTKPPRRKSASPQRVAPTRQYFYSFAKASKLPCPSKFRMRARAIDFFPLKLKECFVMQCDNPDCNAILSDGYLECRKDACNAGEFSASAKFHFFLRVIDEWGDEEDVLVTGNETLLVAGLDPNLLDERRLTAFRHRLASVLGKAVEKYDGMEAHAALAAASKNAPVLEMTMDLWEYEQGRVYQLVEHQIVAV